MALKYQVHPRHANKPVLVTVVNGRAVNLFGVTAEKRHPATATSAAWVEKIPGATQADLKAVYERGDKDVDKRLIVEAVEEQDKKGKE